MPTTDQYIIRVLNIDFYFNIDFFSLPPRSGYAVVMVSSGSLTFVLNGVSIVADAPFLLCLSDKDTLQISRADAHGQAFIFPTDFFTTAEDGEISPVPVGLSAFHRSSGNNGLFQPDRQIYNKLWEWFYIMGAEIHAQSDSLWLCRVKKYLIRIINMLDDLCRVKDRQPVNLALDYIYGNYFNKISLDTLCRQACTNRITLNKLFRQQFNCTAMEYLTAYRMQMAEKILTYTRMPLADVAHATGYEYDTYFIRQFTRYKGMSPTAYRKITQRQVMDCGEIVL